MFWLNKIVGGLISPAGMVTLLMVSLLVVLSWKPRQVKLLRILAVILLLLFWITSSDWVPQTLERALTREIPFQTAEEAPAADAIVILGGGMCVNTNVCVYADMSSAADRVWHAARLYKAGKAPIVIASGENDLASTVPLLHDFGIPDAAIVGEYASRNTEENARYVEQVLKARGGRRILLVTSAWHMRRSLLMFRRYAPGLEVIPAATDYEMMVRGRGDAWTDAVRRFWPDGDAFWHTNIYWKEVFGYWGYRLLRR